MYRIALYVRVATESHVVVGGGVNDAAQTGDLIAHKQVVELQEYMCTASCLLFHSCRGAGYYFATSSPSQPSYARTRSTQLPPTNRTQLCTMPSTKATLIIMGGAIAAIAVTMDCYADVIVRQIDKHFDMSEHTMAYFDHFPIANACPSDLASWPASLRNVVSSSRPFYQDSQLALTARQVFAGSNMIVNIAPPSFVESAMPIANLMASITDRVTSFAHNVVYFGHRARDLATQAWVIAFKTAGAVTELRKFLHQLCEPSVADALLAIVALTSSSGILVAVSIVVPWILMVVRLIAYPLVFLLWLARLMVKGALVKFPPITPIQYHADQRFSACSSLLLFR